MAKKDDGLFRSLGWQRSTFPEIETQLVNGDICILDDGKRRTLKIANTTIFTLGLDTINKIFRECFYGYEERDFKVAAGIVGVEFSVELHERHRKQH